MFVTMDLNLCSFGRKGRLTGKKRFNMRKYIVSTDEDFLYLFNLFLIFCIESDMYGERNEKRQNIKGCFVVWDPHLHFSAPEEQCETQLQTKTLGQQTLLGHAGPQGRLLHGHSYSVLEHHQLGWGAFDFFSKFFGAPKDDTSRNI